MDRNLSRRVEVLFPVEQPNLKQRLISEIIAISLADNVKARELLSNGSYRRLGPAGNEPKLHSQEHSWNWLLEAHAGRHVEEQAAVPAHANRAWRVTDGKRNSSEANRQIRNLNSEPRRNRHPDPSATPAGQAGRGRTRHFDLRVELLNLNEESALPWVLPPEDGTGTGVSIVAGTGATTTAEGWV